MGPPLQKPALQPTKRFAVANPPGPGGRFIDEMNQLVDEMALTLTMLSAGEIPNDSYTLSHLEHYCQSLIDGQRRNTTDLAPNSWSVAPRHDDMPSDVRVDFVFRPTYLAVATLSAYLMQFPGKADELEGLIPTLKSGLTFCTNRGLSGSGYDGPYGMFEAIEILSLGGVPQLLRERPEICPELLELLHKILEDHVAAVDRHETFTQWGTDVSNEMEGIIATLSLLRDPSFLMSIEEGRKEDRSSRKEPIRW